MFFFLYNCTNNVIDNSTANSQLSEAIDPANLTIGFYLQDGVEVLDFAGPLEVFSYAGLKVILISKSLDPIISQGILHITPQYSINDAPKVDVLAFFGGNGKNSFQDNEVIDWIKKQQDIKHYFSVCTGAYALAEAGVLEGKVATTYFQSIDDLRNSYPDVMVKSDVRFVEDGRVITTAGISAGIDGALHFVEKLLGTHQATQVASAMEYDYWKSGKGLVVSNSKTKMQKEVFICPTCNLSCDTLTYEKPGICPQCKMTLIKKKELLPNEVDLKKGSGVFLLEDTEGENKKSLKVYYHMPKDFSDASKILLIIPGAGRNGDDYRDAWVEDSEKYNVLVLSPMFEEEQFPFEDYHLCGLLDVSNLDKAIEYIQGTNQVRIDEEEFSYTINTDREKWIFTRFDRIFDSVIESIDTKEIGYDIFGHSAGGQILHRMAIFNPYSKANRIIAANSGFYTLPDNTTELPFGTKGILTSKELEFSFSKNLTIMVGVLDNERETKGTLLRSDSADKQGTHRLVRGNYFYDFSRLKAAEYGFDFKWKKEFVPNVGHNYKLMGNAAAKLLYE